MLSFRKKRIQTENTVNEILRSARISSGILVDEAANALRISKDYLISLEDGVYEKLPGEVYVKNFIKAYGNYLHLNSDDLLSCYKREKDVYKNIQTNPKRVITNPVLFLSRFHFLLVPRIIKIFVISAVAFTVLMYLGIKVEAIIRPPELFVSTPASDILIDGSYIEVHGIAEEGAQVVINGQDVLVNEDGSFSERINLASGINEIKISAKRNHSKENVIVRRVVVKEVENQEARIKN